MATTSSAEKLPNSSIWSTPCHFKCPPLAIDSSAFYFKISLLGNNVGNYYKAYNEGKKSLLDVESTNIGFSSSE